MYLKITVTGQLVYCRAGFATTDYRILHNTSNSDRLID